MLFFEFFISVAITLFAYLSIPIILVLIEKKLKKKTIIIIVMANCIIGYLFFSYVHYISDSTRIPNFTAAIFWSFIAFRLLKAKCLKETISNDPEHTDFTDLPETDFKNTRQKNALMAALAVLNVLLLCVAVFSIFSNYRLQSKLNKQHEEFLEFRAEFEKYSADKNYKNDLVLDMKKNLDEINSIIGTDTKNIDGDTYLEYRIKRLEKSVGID